MKRNALSDNTRWHAGAVALRQRVASLDSDHGIEFSIKLVDGAIRERRFLLSLHRDSLGTDPAASLAALLPAIGWPAAASAQLWQRLPQAAFVHFGFEQEGAQPLYKLYLEFPRRQPASDWLVHLAFKWRPGGEAIVARYQGGDGLSLQSVQARIESVFAEAPHSPVLELSRALLLRAQQRQPAGSLFLLDVTEEGNPRHSFDLNLYDAGLSLGDMSELLAPVAAALHIPAADLDRVLRTCADEPLGHLSAGLDRRGGPFCTLYFGARTAHGVPLPE